MSADWKWLLLDAFDVGGLRIRWQKPRCAFDDVINCTQPLRDSQPLSGCTICFDIFFPFCSGVYYFFFCKFLKSFRNIKNRENNFITFLFLTPFPFSSHAFILLTWLFLHFLNTLFFLGITSFFFFFFFFDLHFSSSFFSLSLFVIFLSYTLFLTGLLLTCFLYSRSYNLSFFLSVLFLFCRHFLSFHYYSSHLLFKLFTVFDNIWDPLLAYNIAVLYSKAI